MLKRTILIVLSMLTLALVNGCDSPDAREIRTVHDALLRYEETGNGAEAVKLYTSDSFGHYEQLVKLALDGSTAQVRALGPTDRMEVIMMRMMGTRSQLEGLSGRQYIEFATSQGWYGNHPDEPIEFTLSGIRVGRNDATAEVVIDRERSGVRVRFVKEDGAWKYDDLYAIPGWDMLLRDYARDGGMTVDEAIVEILEDFFRREVPETVWQPMRRGR